MLSVPMVVCRYGWRQILRLYQDRLEIDGAAYPLDELVQIQAVYHRIVGIPSARLELHLKEKKILLRGIAEVEEARKIVAYLTGRLKPALPMLCEAAAYYPSRDNAAQSLWGTGNNLPTFQEHSPIISDYVMDSMQVPPTPTITPDWQ